MGIRKYLTDLTQGTIGNLATSALVALFDKVYVEMVCGINSDLYRDLSVGSGLTGGLSSTAGRKTASLMGLGLSLYPEINESLAYNNLEETLPRILLKGMFYGSSYAFGSWMKSSFTSMLEGKSDTQTIEDLLHIKSENRNLQ